MANQDDILEQMTPEERAQSKLHDPTPQRKKYIIDLLYRFLTDQITYSQLTGVSQKELSRISEIAHIKLKHGRIHEAQKIFDCLVQLDNKNPFYRVCLGGAYQKLNRFVDAVYEFSEALKLKKDDLPSLVNRGEIYLKHKNYKRAAEDFRSAILLDPHGRNMYANRARSLVIAIKRNLQLQRSQAAVEGPGGAGGKRPLPGGKPGGPARIPPGPRRSAPPGR